MSKDDLPSPPISHSDVARQVGSTHRAKQVRDPITGFFRDIGDKAEERALKGSTAVANATVENIDAHGGVVNAIMRLRDTVDAYQARDELAPQHYENAVDRQKHQLELEKKSRRQEQVDADRGVFNARQGFEKQASTRTLNQERWTADAYSARTESTIRAETWRGAATPEPDAPEAPQPQASPLEALEQQEAELYALREDALANGRWDDAQRIKVDLDAVRHTIALMKKKAPG